MVLVEDHDMVAEAIALALEQTADIQIVAKSRSIAAALVDTHQCEPDVVLLDRRLPDGDGITAISKLTAAAAGVRVLVLTGEATAAVAARVAEAGGAGVLLKSSRLDELQTAVRQVAAGEVVYGSGLLAGVLDVLAHRGRGGLALTAREHEPRADQRAARGGPQHRAQPRAAGAGEAGSAVQAGGGRHRAP